MPNQNTVTVSFTMDRALYNAYKGVVSARGENVKGNLVRHMQNLLLEEKPNAETLAALKEVEQLKRDPNKKAYGSFAELPGDLDL